jgi:hypothetical protein
LSNKRHKKRVALKIRKKRAGLISPVEKRKAGHGGTCLQSQHSKVEERESLALHAKRERGLEMCLKW